MPLPTLLPFAQWAAIALPTLYAGVTFQYSLTMYFLARTSTTSPPPFNNPKLLARNWLALYQQGPRWVPPLIYTGALANLYLALFSSSSPSSLPSPQHHQDHQDHHQRQKALYLLATLLTISIIPITLLTFEPGVNGACKWKVGQLLKEDGFAMPTPKAVRARERLGTSSVRRHTATDKAREWAERAEMAELMVAWARRNHVRWALGVLAGVVSFVAFGRC